jgi:hypothetical protein
MATAPRGYALPWRAQARGGDAFVHVAEIGKARCKADGIDPVLRGHSAVGDLLPAKADTRRTELLEVSAAFRVVVHRYLDQSPRRGFRVCSPAAASRMQPLT